MNYCVIGFAIDLILELGRDQDFAWNASYRQMFNKTFDEISIVIWDTTRANQLELTTLNYRLNCFWSFKISQLRNMDSTEQFQSINILTKLEIRNNQNSLASAIINSIPITSQQIQMNQNQLNTS